MSCFLHAPLVILKSERAGSTTMMDDLRSILPECNAYPEIVHAISRLHGYTGKCTAAELAEETNFWNAALSSRAIISHNPITQAGGCFAAAKGRNEGVERLVMMLRSHPSKPTVVSLTRRNALRIEVSLHWALETNNWHRHPGISYPPLATKPSALAQKVLARYQKEQTIRTIGSQCGAQLAIEFEDWALRRAPTYRKLLHSVANLSSSVVSSLIEPHLTMLAPHPEREAVSFAAAFSSPNDILAELTRRCMDWMFWGGSYTNVTKAYREPCTHNHRLNMSFTAEGLSPPSKGSLVPPTCRMHLEPWQSDAQGVMGARTTVYYAMGLQKAGTSLMGAALAARLGGGYQNEAVHRCCKQKKCSLQRLSSAAYPTVPHFFMNSIDSYFCQCGHLMVCAHALNAQHTHNSPCTCRTVEGCRT